MWERLRRVQHLATDALYELMDALNGMGNENLGGFILRLSPDNHSGSDYVDTTSITASGGFRH